MPNDMPHFYSDHWIAERYKLAKICGLQDNTDLKLLSSWIASSKWILELGHGDGRVVDYILETNPKCKVVTIENNKSLINYAHQRYDPQKVHTICGDIRNYKLCLPQKKFKLILMLWGLIRSFTLSELEDILGLYSNSLINNGFFVVDMPLDQNHFKEVDDLIKSYGSNDMLLNIHTIENLQTIAKRCYLRVRYQIHYCGRALLFISK